MSEISLKNISKIYKSKDLECIALKNINLNIKQGEFVSLMGTSGSGKSTLLNIIGCIDKQTSGEYFLDGLNCKEKKFNELSKIRNEKISFILQNFGLIKDLTVKDNINMPLEYRKNKKSSKEKIDFYIKSLGLTDILNKKVKLLSGGQQQRVAILRALVQDTDIILADEPTGALDEENSKNIMEILSDLNKNENKTIIVVTHDKDIANYTNRMISLRDGKIL